MVKLADPYGSASGKNPAKYALYLTRWRDDDSQSMVLTFGAPYSARKFLDALFEEDGYIWDDCAPGAEPGTTVRSESGIIVSTRWWPGLLRECVEHEYTLAEMGWTLDRQHHNYAKRFRCGPEMPRTLEEDAAVSERKERKVRAVTASAPAGYVHVSDLALSMGIEPKQARGALRKLCELGQLEKPAWGWSFSPDTLDDLKTRLKAVLK